MKTIRIGARKSDLARLQAYLVGQRLQKHHPQLHIEYFFSSSLGDMNLTDPLWKMPEKGVFTQDLTQKLIEGQMDCVVHSWKDLPTEGHEQTEMTTCLERNDPRDIIFLKKDSIETLQDGQREKIILLSSSPRRAYNLTPFLNSVWPWEADIQFEPVRGNVNTRLVKFLSGSADGLVMAKAALDRLVQWTDHDTLDLQPIQKLIKQLLQKCQWLVAPLSQSPAAPAQGAIAVEILKNNNELKSILQVIHCQKTQNDVECERSVFKSYGGGCHQKIGITKESYHFGSVFQARGLTEKNEAFHWRRLEQDGIDNKKIPTALNMSSARIFPEKMSESSFYERVPINVNLDFLVKNPAFVFVAKHEALPDDAILHRNSVLWVSGLRSWKKLSQRGYWVHGCFDGLGEALYNSKKDYLESWLTFTFQAHDAATASGTFHKVKLSHDEAPHKEGYQLIATYSLKTKEIVPDLLSRSHFYWSSYSTFKRALEKYPDIKEKYHYCGPGYTFEKIKSDLGPDSHVFIELDYFSWRKKMETS